MFIKCIVAGKLTKLVNLLLCRLNQFIAAELAAIDEDRGISVILILEGQVGK